MLWSGESALATSQGPQYLFYTSMEMIQRVYDFGEIAGGADYNCDGFVNDLYDAFDVDSETHDVRPLILGPHP